METIEQTEARAAGLPQAEPIEDAIERATNPHRYVQRQREKRERRIHLEAVILGRTVDLLPSRTRTHLKGSTALERILA